MYTQHLVTLRVVAFVGNKTVCLRLCMFKIYFELLKALFLVVARWKVIRCYMAAPVDSNAGITAKYIGISRVSRYAIATEILLNGHSTIAGSVFSVQRVCYGCYYGKQYKR